MTKISTMRKTYITFSNVGQFEEIVSVFNSFGFNYKNGSNQDAINKVNKTTVDKVICHDAFILTSKDKVHTISYETFMTLAPTLCADLCNEKENTLNNKTTNTMSTQKTMTSGNPKAMLNELKANKLFKDEAYLEGLANTVDETITMTDNFVATLSKAEEKANKVCELAHALTEAIANRDVSEIERLQAMIKGAKVFITKTNKVLSAIQDTGAKIIKDSDKADKFDAAKFIGE